MIKIESILFWILIFSIIGIAIWMLFGSPSIESGLIAVALFVAGSEVMLWKTLFNFDNKNYKRFFKLDKKTTIGFERVRSDFKIIKKDIKDIKENIININKKLK